MATKAERILALFDHEWPSTKWHVQKDAHNATHATVRIRSNDLMTVYGCVYFTPKSTSPLGDAGFRVEINYPAFNGSVEEMEEVATIHGHLVTVVKRMSTTALIKGEDPA